MRKRRIRTACAYLEMIARSGETAAAEVWVKVLAHEKGEPAVIAARALETIADAATEPSLILALEHVSVEVQTAAANALGRVGSVAAVPPLREVTERSGRDGELRHAARQAIAEIQSRVKGASPGQLSLAGDEAGQLSLAQAEAGQLSLATDQAGQLSLPPDEAR